MYALKDALGVDAMNRAMQGLIEDAAYRYDPYPTSRDLIRNIRAQATTDEQQALITDLFEKITLWDLKVDNAAIATREDGKYDVTLNIEAAKFYADGEGQQEETPLDMLIDIGVFSENLNDVFEGDDHVLYFEKHRIESGEKHDHYRR